MFSWRQLGRETLWGRRGLIKIGGLWLPLGALLTLDRTGRAGPPERAALALFAAAAGLRIACTLANDLVDRADDRASGKQRWSAALPAAAGALIVALLAAMSFAALIAAGAPATALGVFAAAFALGLAYSVPPLRAKDRGIAGLGVFSLCCVLHYVVTPWAWFGAGPVLPLALGAAMLADKWVNLHFHQVVDHAADAARGRRTFVVRLGLARARRGLCAADALAATSAAAALAGLALEIPALRIALAGTTAAALAGAWRFARRPGPAPSALARELSAAYLGLSYALFRVAPLLVLGRLALQRPAMTGVFASFALLFALESAYAFRYQYD